MKRNWLILVFLCTATLASAETPVPKAVAPRSGAPAAISRPNQNNGKSAQPSNETKVICAYKGPGYFDAALALKLRDALSPKSSSTVPAPTPAGDSHRPVAKGATFVSQNP